MTDIRTAILNAADHIEAHPEDFRFMATQTPGARGTPGCAVGWVAFFSGMRKGRDYDKACREVLGVEVGNPFYPGTFEGRMQEIDRGWMHDATVCASNLRAYADRYHPATEPQPPDWQQLATQLATQPPIPADA